MHQVVPIRNIKTCIICMDKTLNSNQCVQCKHCFICNVCLKQELNACPLCRKKDFKKKKLKKLECPKCNIEITINCPFIKHVCCLIVTILGCLTVGTFLRLLSGDTGFTYIDILLNLLLGLVIMGSVLCLLICCDCSISMR